MTWVVVWKHGESHTLAHRDDKTFPGYVQAQDWALENLAKNPEYPKEPFWTILPQERAQQLMDGSVEDA